MQTAMSWRGRAHGIHARRRVFAGLLAGVLSGPVFVQTAGAQTQPAAQQPSAQSAVTTPGRTQPPDVLKTPTADDLLRGGYGPYRANNDLLSYHLKLRVDPVAETIAGSNTVRFKMLAPGKRIQLELAPQHAPSG